MSSDTTARRYVCLTSESGLGRIAVNADGWNMRCTVMHLPWLLQVPQSLFVLRGNIRPNSRTLES